MIKDPIVMGDEYLEKKIKGGKSETRLKQNLNSSTIISKIPSSFTYLTEKERIQRNVQNNLLDSSPSANSIDCFYKKLRQRDKKQEIQGPFKLKVQSSLERVYDQLRWRGSLDSTIIQDVYGVNRESQMNSQRESQKTLIHLKKKKSHNSINPMRRSRQIELQMRKSAYKPMTVEDQSEKFKTLIMPKSMNNRDHFKAAQDLLSKNQGALRYRDEEYEIRFRNLARANIIETNFDRFSTENTRKIDRIGSLTKEILEVCNVYRHKKDSAFPQCNQSRINNSFQFQPRRIPTRASLFDDLSQINDNQY